MARKALKVYFFLPHARPVTVKVGLVEAGSGSGVEWGQPHLPGARKWWPLPPTLAVTTKSRLTGGVSIAILRSPGCSVLRWILGVGLHPHESRKTRHTVVFCILFICDASSSRSRTPRWRRAIPAGQRPTSRADVPHLGDLPSSQIMISGNDRRLLDNLRKPGLLALLRDFWNRGTADRRHEGGHGSW